MLLAIDIGNTNIVLGLFRQEKLLHHWRIPTPHPARVGELGAGIEKLLAGRNISPARVRQIAIACVVPALEGGVKALARKYFKLEPIIADNESVGLPNRYRNPREVGADRLVNALAGYRLYGGPLIVVDFGTATTFCLVSGAGEYLGGCIAPGLQLSAKVLHDYTAKLPRVRIARPEQVIGKTTEASIRSGLFYGYAAMVEGLVSRIQDEFGEKTKVVATGGLAPLIGRQAKCIQEINPWLTLEGLRLVAAKKNPPRRA